MDTHWIDTDCTVDPQTDTCEVCGVYHGDECGLCGGRGYHNPGCIFGISKLPRD